MKTKTKTVPKTICYLIAIFCIMVFFGLGVGSAILTVTDMLQQPSDTELPPKVAEVTTLYPWDKEASAEGKFAVCQELAFAFAKKETERWGTIVFPFSYWYNQTENTCFTEVSAIDGNTARVIDLKNLTSRCSGNFIHDPDYPKSGFEECIKSLGGWVEDW
jgi:hypothetical protein